MKKIVFTGGGSAGHVVPNIALMRQLERKYDLYYMGSNGIEKSLIAPLKIPYGEIDCPKFIRGFSLKNLTIPFRFFRAVKEAEKILRAIQPDLVFSKGGYVALPTVTAAKKLKIPCLTHESDLSLGLANKLMSGKCEFTLTAFPQTAESIINGRYVGAPLRQEIFNGERNHARAKYGFEAKKKVLLILGGGSGSRAINEAIRNNLFALCKKYYVLHLCGKGNAVYSNVAGYIQCEFETDMASAYAAADGVVARAGANTVFETLALKKPTVFIPLENSRSRGDQLKNARYFEKQGLCKVLRERNIADLPLKIEELFIDTTLQENLVACEITNGSQKIIECMEEFL